MANLDTQLSAGQDADLDRSWYNDLVSRLNSDSRASAMEVGLSSDEARVHPDDSADHPLVPSDVFLSDSTDWGGMSDERVLVEWELVSGPGHLEASGGSPVSTLETGPNTSVTWGWYHSNETNETNDSYYDSRDTRDWDATPGEQNLPVAATVRATGKVLTTAVHGSSVTATSDLVTIASADVSDDDQRLVTNNRTVYKLNTSSTDPTSGDIAWDPEAASSFDGTFDGEVSGSSNLTSLGTSTVSDGDIYLDTDTGDYYKLDTSDTDAVSGDDVAWNPDTSDSDNEGTWLFQETIDGVWEKQTGPFYTEVGSIDKVISVRRGYDPQRVPGTRIVLRPTGEIAYIDADGEASVSLVDESVFDDDADEVNRAVEAQFTDLSPGEGVTVDTDPGDTDDLLTYNTEEKQIDVTVTRAGELTVTAEYTVIDNDNSTSTTTTAKRRFYILPAPDPSMGATTDPKPPVSDFNAGAGRCEVVLGRNVTITSVSTAGGFFDDGVDLKWQESRLAEVARRLDLDDLQVDATGEEDATITKRQAQILTKAGTLLNAALGQSNDFGLARHDLEIDGNTDFLNEGHVIRSGNSRFRVQQVTESGVIKTVGFEESSLSTPADGRATGAGQLFTVEMKATYGTPGADNFPQREVKKTRIVDPVTDPHKVGMTLPEAEPDSVTDAWHVRHRVSARWNNGAVVTSDWSTREKAEPVPDAQLNVSVDNESNGRQKLISLDGSPNDATFYGRAGWVDAENAPTGQPDSETKALEEGSVPEQIRTHPPVHHVNGSVFVVEGHHRMPGGTGQPSVQRHVSDRHAPPGLPRIPSEAEDPTNDVDVPPFTGAVLDGTSRRWISVDGMWAPIGTGTEMIGVETAQLFQDGTLTGSTVRDSSTRFSGQINFPATNNVTIQMLTRGGVSEANLVSGPAGNLTFDEDAGRVEVQFPMQEQMYDQTLQFVVRLVPKGSIAEERTITYALKDGSASNLGDPEIYSVTARGSGGTEASSITQNNLTWEIKHSSGWDGMRLELITRHVDNVVDVTAAPDFDHTFYPGERPPYIYIDSSQADATYTVTVENEAGTQVDYTIDVIDNS